MYTIFCDDEEIFVPGIEEKTVFDPELHLELNTAGSLTFTVPETNASYDKIKKLKSTITVRRDNADIWRGRVLTTDRDFLNRKTFTCEGDLAFLNDVILRPFSYTGTLEGYLRFVLGKYNAVCDRRRRFELGDVTVIDTSDVFERSIDDYRNVWDVLNEQLLETVGGYFITHSDGIDTYLDYVSEPGQASEQMIMFGENLIDLSEQTNADDVYTVIIPVGGIPEVINDEPIEERTTIAVVNAGKDYLESPEGIALFGRIERVIEFETADPAELLELAKQTLESAFSSSVTLEIDAIDLNLIDPTIDALDFGSYVRCVSIPHRIDGRLILSKMDIPLDKPSGTKYYLGAIPGTLTSSVKGNANTGEATALGAVVVHKSDDDSINRR